ncbi:MAG: LuxR C-terminal-related transcriptional regulator [Campylobacterota bacterium]|nr:LuxR C-terminal-related transcriptional regulator [Campylobacterota bacterium]
MQVIYFSSNFEMLDEFLIRDNNNPLKFYDVDKLLKWTNKLSSYVVIVDYDSMAKEINQLISSGNLPQNVIILERAPAVVTGKMLISHGVKAYGNSRMLPLHYQQMLDTVIDEKVWTYPELTAALIKETNKNPLNSYAKSLINARLTAKEKETIYLVLEGLTNDAIASKLDITTRTVKAHVSSIFTKLHVNDRVSLVLLLK